MKTSRWWWILPGVCCLVAGCKPRTVSTATENSAADRVVAEDRLAEERQRLADERAALERDREVLRAEREARLASREEAAATQDAMLGGKQAALAEQAVALGGREGDLSAREAKLSEEELALAGREALAGWEPEPAPEEQQPVADYGTFYDGLQPYGSWFGTPDYGYVFQPAVVIRDGSWRPYTHGRWACSNRGWTWLSDEPFGWACFHYGRWVLLGRRGWVWVPGDEWAPSWVTWREGGGYVGWAPLPPETMCWREHGWGSGVEQEFGIGAACFTFVRASHMADPLWPHCLPAGQNNTCMRDTVNVTHFSQHYHQVVVGGPRYEALLRAVGKPWSVYQLELDHWRALRDAALRATVVRGDRLALFAPNLNARWNEQMKPSAVAGRWEDVAAARAEGGLAAEWQQRFHDAREKQKAAAVAWTREQGDTFDKQKDLLANQEKVAAAEAKLRARREEMTLARQAKPANLGQDAEVVRRQEQARLSQQEETQRAATEQARQEQQQRQELAKQAERLRGQEQARLSQQEEAQRAAAEQARQEQQQQQELAKQTERLREQEQARLNQQEEVQRAAVERGRREQRQQQELAKQTERLREQEQVRLRQQEEAQRAAVEQARQQQQQERLRQQEEAQRAAAERARQEQQQERLRQQEEAQRAAAERARQEQQQEHLRQQEENRRAAEERTRQQQERARDSGNQPDDSHKHKGG